MKKSYIIKKCWCNGKLSKKSFNLGYIPSCDSYSKKYTIAKKAITTKLDVCYCLNCYLVQLRNRIIPKFLYEKYIYKSSDSPGLEKHFKEFAEYISENFSKKKNFLDIGCNEGLLLNFLKKKKKVRVTGIEPSDIGVNGCKQKKIKVYKSYFNKDITKKIIAERGHQDVVFANNVLANIENLKDFFINVNKLLKIDGYFIIETITLETITKSLALEMINHEHYYYFTRNSIANLAKNTDFKLIKTIDLKLKGSSKRFILKKINSNKKNNFIKDLIKIEQFFQLKKIIEKRKSIFIKKLTYYTNKNYNIYGFGAYAGATILIYYFNLDKKLKAIFDDNKNRLGLFSPKSCIIVENISKIKITHKSILINLAWRYTKIIERRHIQNLKKFDYFINPLPLLKVKKIVVKKN